MSAPLRIERDGAVATVMLDRPEVRNALDETLMDGLAETYEQLGGDDSVRAIVLRGNGKSFCAGADLAWMGRMAGYTQDENRADARRLRRLFDAIHGCPKATFAAVHGAAMGGGAGLAAVCDWTVSTLGAVFCFSEVKLGLIPAVIAPYVIEKIGHGAARALFVTARRFEGNTALQLGLVQELALDAVSAANAAAREAAANGPEAVAAVKALLRELRTMSADAAGERTVEAIATIRVSPEGQEGVRAFLEKRPPRWQGDERQER